MPRFRIFYAEHGEATETSLTGDDAARGDFEEDEEAIETEWEESLDAKDPVAALQTFFGEHAPNRNEIRVLEEDGSARMMDPTGDFDPDRTYVWVEEGTLMEYQGIQEATPGMVTCPLCDGTGEVDEAVAEEFEAAMVSSDED